MPPSSLSNLEHRTKKLAARLAMSGTLRDTIRLSPPLPHQRPFLDTAARFKVLRAGRRWGKTVAALWAAIFGHGSEGQHYPGVADGVSILVLCPDYPQARNVWRLLRALFKGLPDFAVDQTRMTVEFPNGEVLELRSAENIDSVRGRKFGGAVIDEAAFLDLEYSYNSVVRPALADQRGWCILISTPRLGSYFNDVCANAEAETGSFKPFHGRIRDNSSLPADEIEELYASYPPGCTEVRQELDAELISDHGELFDRALFQTYDAVDSHHLYVPRLGPLPIADRRGYIDLAASMKTSGDYTVVLSAALTRTIGGRRLMAVLDVQRRRIEGPDQVALIKDAVKAHGLSAVKVEAVGYQLTMVQQLKRELHFCRVEELRADKDKRSRAIPAAAAVARGDILVPKSAPWLPDFLSECVLFPRGKHDDQVDAFAYAAADLSLGTPHRRHARITGVPNYDAYSGAMIREHEFDRIFPAHTPEDIAS